MDEPILYHIAKAEAWASAQSAGTYRTPDLPQTGFIHLCTPTQLPFVRNKFFPVTTGFLLLQIDPTKLSAPLKYEPSEPDQPPFPHLYGPLNTDAVSAVQPLP
ncbi:MAG: DUF952 domain-containing protein [Bryobacteraceae bacterium]